MIWTIIIALMAFSVGASMFYRGDSNHLFAERFRWDEKCGFYLDKHDCPLCPAELAKNEYLPCRLISDHKIECPIHGIVHGAEPVSTTTTNKE